jgi:Helix-turn-helix domain
MDGIQHIGASLVTIEQNMRINSADPVARHGFTQVPNFILKNPDVSVNAKLVYALLLSYAWHNDCCFPGQERLAQHMGVNISTVSRAMTELHASSLIDIERRGLGKTNYYTINFVAQKKSKR